MRAEELFVHLPPLACLGGKSGREIGRITDDSRRITGADALFVARRKTACYAIDAYRRGCRSFLSECRLPLPDDARQFICRSVTKSAAEATLRAYGYPQKKLRLIAVTGTKGKTTTAFCLTRLLRFSGEKTALIGTLGLDLGDGTHPTENTTPSFFSLVPMLALCVRRGVHTVILEASSQGLLEGRLYGLAFSLGIFTSFSPDHIGKGEHRDLAEYREAKRSLFSSYGIECAVANGEDPISRYMISDVPERRFITADGGDPPCEILSQGRDGTRFRLAGAEGFLSLPGRYNLQNALLAVESAHLLTGRPYAALLAPLCALRVPGRFERLSIGGKDVYIDYAHNAQSVTAFLAAVRPLCRGRLIALFGSVGDRGIDRRRRLAAAVEDGADFAVITADDTARETALSVCADLYAAFRDKTKACILTDRARAIRYAYSITGAGDALLLLGKGHERFLRDENGKHPFSEKKILTSLDKSFDMW